MKKLIMLLGVASLLAASPVLAASPAKAPMKPVAAHSQMCTLHGKKVACRHHAMKKHHVVKKHALSAKVPVKKKSSY